jgi:hypothetical protein
VSAPAGGIERLAEALRQVRVAYDKYIMGLERQEPLKERAAAKQLLLHLLGETQRNTATKFRLQTLQASWLTWETYWNRIARQIEEGTFKRDKQKAMAQLRPPEASLGAPETAPGAAKATPGGPEATPASTPGPRSAAGHSPTEHVDGATVRNLLAAFEAARAELGLPPGGTSLASLTATVNRQAAALKAQYNCAQVTFKVAIKDGRPILKASPR